MANMEGIKVLANAVIWLRVVSYFSFEIWQDVSTRTEGTREGRERIRKKKQSSPRPNLSSFLANNLHNFNFSLASRGPEEQQDDRLRLNTTFK